MSELSKDELLEEFSCLMARWGGLIGKEMQAYKQLKALIQNQPEVDKEFIEEWSYNLEWKDKDELRDELIERMLTEAGIKIKED